MGTKLRGLSLFLKTLFTSSRHLLFDLSPGCQLHTFFHPVNEMISMNLFLNLRKYDSTDKFFSPIFTFC